MRLADLLRGRVLIDDVDAVEHQPAFELPVKHLPAQGEHLAGAGFGGLNFRLGDLCDVVAGRDGREIILRLDLFGVEIE